MPSPMYEYSALAEKYRLEAKVVSASMPTKTKHGHVAVVHKMLLRKDNHLLQVKITSGGEELYFVARQPTIEEVLFHLADNYSRKDLYKKWLDKVGITQELQGVHMSYLARQGF